MCAHLDVQVPDPDFLQGVGHPVAVVAQVVPGQWLDDVALRPDLQVSPVGDRPLPPTPGGHNPSRRWTAGAAGVQGRQGGALAPATLGGHLQHIDQLETERSARNRF